MPEPVASALSIVALKKLLEGLYNAAAGQLKTKLKHIQNDADQRKIFKAISCVGKVKTMWSMDKEVKLLPIYYPSRVIVNESAKEVSRVNDIDPTNSFVIRGTVGQGKSIFLRYLCLEELKLAQRVPVFVELRRFERTKTFRQFLEERLTVMGMDSDHEAFEYFAKSGKLLLLLDGFDELELDAVSGVISEIESLVQQYSGLQVVVTTRPDSGIDKSPLFRVYQLAPLTPNDHAPFLHQIITGNTQVTEILTAIRKSSAGIQTLLTTPLLLTLLVIVYNATQAIPPSLSAFYDELFRTLAIRHDSNKPGFRRPRATKLSDWDIRRLFEAFCYGARQKNLLLLSHSIFEALLTTASKHTGIIASPDDFAKDITKVTCLMQKEGFQYEFIHKSVAEFHAAYFIQRSTDDGAQKFYSLLIDRKWMAWKQELIFLSELDRHRYLKYFYIPSIKRAMSHYGVDVDNAPDIIATESQVVMRVFAAYVVKFPPTPGAGPDGRALPRSVHIQWGNSMLSFPTENFESTLITRIATLLQDLATKNPETLTTEGIALADLAAQSGLVGSIIKIMNEVLTELLARYKAAVSELGRDDAVSDFINP
jgi:NACHT domain